MTSEELDNLSLQAGSFRKVSPRTGSGDEDMTTEYGTRQVKGDRLNYLGGNYKPLDGLEISSMARISRTSGTSTTWA